MRFRVHIRRRAELAGFSSVSFTDEAVPVRCHMFVALTIESDDALFGRPIPASSRYRRRGLSVNVLSRLAFASVFG
jgi:hypothetical protein